MRGFAHFKFLTTPLISAFGIALAGGGCGGGVSGTNTQTIPARIFVADSSGGAQLGVDVTASTVTGEAISSGATNETGELDLLIAKNQATVLSFNGQGAQAIETPPTGALSAEIMVLSEGDEFEIISVEFIAGGEERSVENGSEVGDPAAPSGNGSGISSGSGSKPPKKSPDDVVEEPEAPSEPDSPPPLGPPVVPPYKPGGDEKGGGVEVPTLGPDDFNDENTVIFDGSECTERVDEETGMVTVTCPGDGGSMHGGGSNPGPSIEDDPEPPMDPGLEVPGDSQGPGTPAPPAGSGPSTGLK